MQRVVDLNAVDKLDGELIASLQIYLNDCFSHGRILEKLHPHHLKNLAEQTTFKKNASIKQLPEFRVTFSHDLIAVECNEEKIYYLIDRIEAKTDWSITFYASASFMWQNDWWHFKPSPPDKYCVTTTQALAGKGRRFNSAQ